MLYINEPGQSYVTYDQAVEVVKSNGVDPKRAYIYLMAFGIKGALGRAISDDGVDYLPAEKMAVRDGKVVKKLEICTNCKGLLIT